MLRFISISGYRCGQIRLFIFCAFFIFYSCIFDSDDKPPRQNTKPIAKWANNVKLAQARASHYRHLAASIDQGYWDDLVDNSFPQDLKAYEGKLFDRIRQVQTETANQLVDPDRR